MGKENEVAPKKPSISTTTAKLKDFPFANQIVMFLYITILVLLIISGLQSLFESAATITNSELVTKYEKKTQVTAISDKGEFTLKDGTKLKNIQVSIGPKLGYGFGQYMVDGNTFVEGMTIEQTTHSMIYYICVSLVFFMLSIYICMGIKTKDHYRAMFVLVVLILALDLMVGYLFSSTFCYMKGHLSTLMGISLFIIALVKYFFIYTKAKKAYFFRPIVGVKL